MTLQGKVQGGVVVLENGGTLPEGTLVTVIVSNGTKKQQPKPKTGQTIWEKLVQLGRDVESLPCDLPEDLAKNHDHYLHGHPKRP